MRKIITLFERDFENNPSKVVNKVTHGAEWVINNEGVATVKIDGTCCKVEDGVLYKRFDRKLTKENNKKRLKGEVPAAGWINKHCKPPPTGWISAQLSPDPASGHWPGWVRVGGGPEDRWHREPAVPVRDGTYELIGPKIQANPYNADAHGFIRHGSLELDWIKFPNQVDPFGHIRSILYSICEEGIVWHHPDRRMVKIKRKDFGLQWPLT